jgi:hypothetical protein
LKLLVSLLVAPEFLFRVERRMTRQSLAARLMKHQGRASSYLLGHVA